MVLSFILKTVSIYLPLHNMTWSLPFILLWLWAMVASFALILLCLTTIGGWGCPLLSISLLLVAPSASR